MKKEGIKTIARKRIKRLFELAELHSKDRIDLSNRYVKIARDIAMRLRLRIPPELKRKFCKHCYSYFVPSRTCRVRTREGLVVYTCFSCKKFTKYKY